MGQESTGSPRGTPLADENLVRRPSRFLSDEHTERLEAMRATYDQDGRLLSYLMPNSA